MTGRVVLLTPDFPPAVGGIQRVAEELATRLAQEREVVVVAPRQRGSDAYDSTVPCRIIRTAAGWGGAGSAAVLAEMAVRTRMLRPAALVLGHVALLPAAGNAGRIAGLLYGSELWSPTVRRILDRGSWSKVQRFAAISAFTKQQAVAAGLPADRIAVTPLGGDAPAAPPDSDDVVRAHGLVDDVGALVPYLLTVSRLEEPHKGQDTVIRSLPPILARVPDARYVIVGDGRLRRYLEDVARATGVLDRVVFTGQVDRRTRDALLSRCRALTMVSRETRAAAQFEGFGLVYVEAARAGRPSIAGRAGGAPEVVQDGVTGLVVEPEDGVAVTDACLRLLEEPERADELGRRAREHAEIELTWERGVERLVDGLDLLDR